MYLPSEVTREKKTEKIGDTLFIDGVPYIECGNCHAIIKKFQGESGIRFEGSDKFTRNCIRTVKEYKVLIGHWIGVSEHLGTDKDGVELLKTGMKPVVHTVPACVSCWQIQQDMKVSNPGRFVFFPDR